MRLRLRFLLPVALVAAPALAQAPAGHAGTARGAAANDPTVKAARRAQQTFELARRFRLPTYTGGAAGPCEIRIGRLCYWDNNDDARPPEEPATVAREREVLLEALARAAAAAPTDDWTAGQRVRYLSEARRFADAVAAATDCRATRWWCDALRGLALHQRNDHLAAADAFDGALAAMPPEDRCRWTDLSLWLPDRASDEYDRLRCGPDRDRWERRFWSVTQPLLILPGNDLRNELFARRVMTRVEAEGINPYSLAWGNDLTESEIRYGWPTAWSVRSATFPSVETRGVVGHEPTPSFDFVPGDRALTRPGQAAANDWKLRGPLARMRYAPRYAPRGFVDLPHQIARFRRGDSTLVVGAWDVDRDRGWDAGVADSLAAAPRVVDAGLALVDTAGGVTRAIRPAAPRRGAVVVAVDSLPRLASLEVLDSVRGRAARARYALQPLPADARISDVLLLTRGSGPAADLDSLLDEVQGAPVVRVGGVVGLYWESYLPATPDAPVTVSVSATRLDTRWHERARSRLGIGTRVTPVAVRFADIGRPDGKPGRSLTLTWPSVPRGDYRLEITATRGVLTATTSQVVRVE